MAITRFRPATDRLESSFQSMFDDFFGSSWGGRLGGADLLRAPFADVQETSDDIRVTVEVPGLRSEDIEINLENNVLTVSGEKRQEAEEENGSLRWHLSERRYGRFSRSFVLPRHLQHDAIEAHLENGVLQLRIPKSEEAKPRRIEIHGGEKRKRLMGK